MLELDHWRPTVDQLRQVGLACLIGRVQSPGVAALQVLVQQLLGLVVIPTAVTVLEHTGVPRGFHILAPEAAHQSLVVPHPDEVVLVLQDDALELVEA